MFRVGVTQCWKSGMQKTAVTTLSKACLTSISLMTTTTVTVHTCTCHKITPQHTGGQDVSISTSAVRAGFATCHCLFGWMSMWELGSAMVRSVVCEVFYISAQHMNIHASPLSRRSSSVCADLPGWNAVTAFPANDHVLLALTHIHAQGVISDRECAVQHIRQQQPNDFMLVGCRAYVSHTAITKVGRTYLPLRSVL